MVEIIWAFVARVRDRVRVRDRMKVAYCKSAGTKYTPHQSFDKNGADMG